MAKPKAAPYPASAGASGCRAAQCASLFLALRHRAERGVSGAEERAGWGALPLESPPPSAAAAEEASAWGSAREAAAVGFAALQQGCARAALPAPPDEKHLLSGSLRLEASPPRSSGEYLEPQRREVTCVPCLCTDPLSQASPHCCRPPRCSHRLPGQTHYPTGAPSVTSRPFCMDLNRPAQTVTNTLHSSPCSRGFRSVL